MTLKEAKRNLKLVLKLYQNAYKNNASSARKTELSAQVGYWRAQVDSHARCGHAESLEVSK